MEKERKEASPGLWVIIAPAIPLNFWFDYYHPLGIITTCLIVAIRTAKWSARHDAATSDIDLAKEIDYATHISQRVLANLMSKYPTIFPRKKEPWYRATSEDHPERAQLQLSSSD